MNNTLPILSTMALGIIAGVTGTHFQHVSTMMAKGLQPAPVILNPAQTLPDAVSSGVMLASIDSPVATPPTAVSMPVHSNTLTLNEKSSLQETLLVINGSLQKVLKENSHLRKQLSDTNRDMDELTFRVDSQSSEFRPLSTQQDRPRGLITTPANIPEADSQGLLPSKN